MPDYFGCEAHGAPTSVKSCSPGKKGRMSRCLCHLPPIAAAVLVGISLTGCSAQTTSASHVGTTTATLNAGLSLLRADPMINPDPTYIWGPGDEGEGVEADRWYGGALSAKTRDRLSYSAT